MPVLPMSLPHRPGTLPNLTKTEFADLFLKYTDQALALKDGEAFEVDVDGRKLRIFHSVFPRRACDDELREWSVTLTTLNQRTPKCLAKVRQRQAWLYLAPFLGEGYKSDPTGKWRYSVWN